MFRMFDVFSILLFRLEVNRIDDIAVVIVDIEKPPHLIRSAEEIHRYSNEFSMGSEKFQLTISILYIDTISS